MRGIRVSEIQIGRQKRRVEISLHWANATGALMPALRQRLFDRLATAVTELAEFGRARGNFEQGAARTCNGAPQEFYKHPWCSQSYTSPILFLPGLVGNFLNDDGVADRHDLMNLVPMQALAVRGQS